jgi:hypothetical protein
MGGGVGRGYKSIRSGVPNQKFHLQADTLNGTRH